MLWGRENKEHVRYLVGSGGGHCMFGRRKRRRGVKWEGMNREGGRWKRESAMLPQTLLWAGAVRAEGTRCTEISSAMKQVKGRGQFEVLPWMTGRNIGQFDRKWTKAQVGGTAGVELWFQTYKFWEPLSSGVGVQALFCVLGSLRREVSCKHRELFSLSASWWAWEQMRPESVRGEEKGRTEWKAAGVRKAGQVPGMWVL
jgi:hypothetical protein